jgi:endonuclease YncB( thermonuclease family)
MIEPTILRQGTRMCHPSSADFAIISLQPHAVMPPRTSDRRLTSWCAGADLPSRTAAARRHCRVSAWMGFILLLSLALVVCTQPGTEGLPADGEPVVVRYVVDGDTVELEDGRTVRYIGINAPELHQPFYEEATGANRRLVDARRQGWCWMRNKQTDSDERLPTYGWVSGSSISSWCAWAMPPRTPNRQRTIQCRDCRRGAAGPGHTSRSVGIRGCPGSDPNRGVRWSRPRRSESQR